MGFRFLRKWRQNMDLNDDSHSTMASFFDYDNDGDLDVYITVNEIVPKAIILPCTVIK